MSASEHSLAEIVLVGSADANGTKQNGVSSVSHNISLPFSVGSTWVFLTVLCLLMFIRY
jgi:hypothetical protein